MGKLCRRQLQILRYSTSWETLGLRDRLQTRSLVTCMLRACREMTRHVVRTQRRLFSPDIIPAALRLLSFLLALDFGGCNCMPIFVFTFNILLVFIVTFIGFLYIINLYLFIIGLLSIIVSYTFSTTLTSTVCLLVYIRYALLDDLLNSNYFRIY